MFLGTYEAYMSNVTIRNIVLEVTSSYIDINYNFLDEFYYFYPSQKHNISTPGGPDRL